MNRAAPAYERFEWSEPLLPPGSDPSLEKEVQSTLGMVPQLYRFTSPSPWLAQASLLLHRHRVSAFLTPRMADLVKLVVSQDNSCRYCYGLQRFMLRVMGHSEEAVETLEEDLLRADMEPKTRVALDFARRVSRYSPSPTGKDLADLAAAGHGRQEVAELAFLVSMVCFNNRTATFLALPPESAERMAGSWYFRFLRPLMRWRMGSSPKPLPAAVPNPPGAPLSRLVEALAPSPSAYLLRRVVDLAFASPASTPRLRGLIFAVVARSLGCAFCENQARESLRRHGLGTEQMDEVLTHLGAPFLEPLEAAAVSFARETVRYQNRIIHQSVRRLRERFGPAVALELIGQTALANMVVRLELLMGAIR